MSFEELRSQNLARVYADALESSLLTRRVNLPVNEVDVTSEVILKFL